MFDENAIRHLSRNVRVAMRAKDIPKSLHYPTGVDFAVSGQVCLLGVFRDAVRVDNSLHEGRIGTHAHFFDKGRRKGRIVVEYLNDIQTPQQAESYIEEYLRKRYLWLIEGDKNAS